MRESVKVYLNKKRTDLNAIFSKENNLHLSKFKIIFALVLFEL